MSDEEELVELLREPEFGKEVGRYWFAGTLEPGERLIGSCLCFLTHWKPNGPGSFENAFTEVNMEPTEIILKGLRHILLIGECERCGMVAVGEYPPDWTEAPF